MSHVAAFLLGAVCGGPFLGWRAAKYHTKMKMIRGAIAKARKEAV